LKHEPPHRRSRPESRIRQAQNIIIRTVGFIFTAAIYALSMNFLKFESFNAN
jgi:hypothetical protein